MTSLRNIVFGCVSERSHQQQQQQASTSSRHPHKVKFDVPLSESLKDGRIPLPLTYMLVYIAQDGVTTTDLFRRPGNATDAKLIQRRMAEGREVDFSNYNFYTLASVLKQFLLRIPGGIFGPEVERKLLAVLDISDRVDQYAAVHEALSMLPQATQQLVTLLFGTWFRIVNHAEYNTMSSEAVAKSVAGSLFHTCSTNLQGVNRAVQVLQILIDDFGVSTMFGAKNIQYFADMTRTGIRVREKHKYEVKPGTESVVPSGVSIVSEEDVSGMMRSRADTKDSADTQPSVPPSPQSLQPQPPENPHRKLTTVSSLSAPEVNEGYSPPPQDTLTPSKRMYLSTSLNRFDYVKRRQLMRMKKRSHWFLTPHTPSSTQGSSSEALTPSDCATPERTRLSSTTDSSPRLTPADIVNGNSTKLKPPPRERSPSHSPTSVSEQEVRMFMAEEMRVRGKKT